MGRLIDADDVAENLMNSNLFDCDDIDVALQAVKLTDTIDPESLRSHGRWIAVPSSDMMTGKAYKCSQCNVMRWGAHRLNFCPYCGAKMEES